MLGSEKSSTPERLTNWNIEKGMSAPIMPNSSTISILEPNHISKLDSIPA